MHQPGVISGLLEQRQRRSRESLQLVDGRIGRVERAVVGGADTGERLGCLVARYARPLGGGVGNRGGLRAPERAPRRGRARARRPSACRPGQLERPFEQPGGGPFVAAPERTAAGGREPLASAFRESRVGLSELLLVAGGLLEVVAEDLVQLGQLVSALCQPAGEALVQLRPRRLGESVVGGIADQEVAEAEAVLTRELRGVGADQLAAHERGQPRRHLRLLRAERLDGAAVEDLALDRAALEHPPLAGVELVEAGGEQRLQGRRHLDLVARLTRHRQHLADEQRVAAGRSGDLRAQLLRHARPIRLSASWLLSGSSRTVTGQEGRLSSSSGRAIHNSRSGAPLESSATCSTRSRNVSSPHWMSSNTTTSGACSSSSLRNAQAISSADVPASDFPSSERIAAAAAGSDGNALSCLTISTTGE